MERYRQSQAQQNKRGASFYVGIAILVLLLVAITVFYVTRTVSLIKSA